MDSKPACISKLALAALLSLSLSGCDAIAVWNRIGAVLFGGGEPQKVAKKATAPTGSAAQAGSGSVSGEYAYTSENAKRAKANAEILHEMYRVVFNREPRDRSTFGSYVDTLNQGASLEGVYNGFTHSSDYRDIETENPGSSPDALRIFSQELARLEMELPASTEFDARAAKPLAMPVEPGLEESADPGVPQTLEFGQKPMPAHPRKLDPQAIAAKYATAFSGASIYTLKRVIGDEALKVIAAKKDYRDQLGGWYSKWVVHMASYRLDFGVPLRNKADEEFHYKWALSASTDRLEWEVLNRLHRLLNAANTVNAAKQPEKGK